jgi:REP element-mobilizing transposase RayT
MKFKMKKQFRLPDYDYTESGNYFVTICIHDREKDYFGEIKDGEMILSPLGYIAGNIWNSIPKKFPGITLGEYCIMPDHFHGILRNNNPLKIKDPQSYNIKCSSGIKNNPMELKDKSLGYIIRWFKAKVKYESAKQCPLFRWQKRYYERVIRDDKEFYFIEEYIRNNPLKFEHENKIIEEDYLNKVFSKKI